MVKAVLSVIGCDRVGIIAAVSGYFAKVNVNIRIIANNFSRILFFSIILIPPIITNFLTQYLNLLYYYKYNFTLFFKVVNIQTLSNRGFQTFSSAIPLRIFISQKITNFNIKFVLQNLLFISFLSLLCQNAIHYPLYTVMLTFSRFLAHFLPFFRGILGPFPTTRGLRLPRRPIPAPGSHPRGATLFCIKSAPGPQGPGAFVVSWGSSPLFAAQL